MPFGPGTFISERTQVSNMQATSLVRSSEDTEVYSNVSDVLVSYT